MKLRYQTSEIFVPDGQQADSALARTTDLGIAAHQDDLEILAYPGILKCFGQAESWFTGVVVTNGAGSPRSGLYEAFNDEQMQAVRREEQRKAAVIGDYAAMAQLDYPSNAVKDPANPDVVDDIRDIIEICKPRVIWTHNLADKHDTHIAVALRTISALRKARPDARPMKVYGVEVWRDLDWLVEDDKQAFDVADRENLASALLGVFDSQIAGGKRYDLATLGRRRAHATYHASHGTDDTTQLVFGMDLTPLVDDVNLDPQEYANSLVTHLANDIADRISRFS